MGEVRLIREKICDNNTIVMVYLMITSGVYSNKLLLTLSFLSTNIIR